MRIVNVRRISQAFFLALFCWFCVVTTAGTRGWQIRGWPVNWFLDLDPLAALGTFLASGRVPRGMAWSLVTIALTVVFGRVFCGWVCPFGTIHQAVGWLGRRRRGAAAKITLNEYHKAQAIKYYILFLLLAAAAGGLLASLRGPARLPVDRIVAGSLQTGLLDPIPLAQRSLNLVLLPLADRAPNVLFSAPRWYAGAWLIGGLFVGAILLNLVVPRFYCRFVCPLGALLGVLSRFSLWRIGKTQDACSMCMKCEADCEGACEPARVIRSAECVLCMNCLHVCPDEVIRYRVLPSASGEKALPDVTRRGFLVSLASGVVTVPMMRLAGAVGANWNPRLIRPPGSLPEEDFLERCIKCGQCMRICPTNIIQPAGLEAGVEGLWTPTLNFRIGTSGCQLNCISCGHVCPTSAIRPLSLDEKMGRHSFEGKGPVRMGLAFVDRGRCLPWAMERPCLVCQENCPVSPKAIYVEDSYVPTREILPPVKHADELTLEFDGDALVPGRLASGDHYVVAPAPGDGRPRRIVENTAQSLTIASTDPWDPAPGEGFVPEIRIRLQRPYVDPERCIGCGVCEHECPVAGLRAIRVTSENETRTPAKSILA